MNITLNVMLSVWNVHWYCKYTFSFIMRMHKATALWRLLSSCVWQHIQARHEGKQRSATRDWPMKMLPSREPCWHSTVLLDVCRERAEGPGNRERIWLPAPPGMFCSCSASTVTCVCAKKWYPHSNWVMEIGLWRGSNASVALYSMCTDF